MKCMLLIYSNSATWEALSEKQRREMAREHAALVGSCAQWEWSG